MAPVPPEAAALAEPDEVDANAAAGLAACIAPFVDGLPSAYREAVTRVGFFGIIHSDAARALGLSVPGVKSRVQRARAKLRAMFEACCRIELDARRRVIDHACQRCDSSRCC